MTSENYFTLCWKSSCFVTGFTCLFMGVCATNFCATEGDCVVLRCPYPKCGNTSCFRASEETAGPIYVIRWTHLEDTKATARKEHINEDVTLEGKFKEGVEVLPNGDLKILNVDTTFNGTYSCDVYPQLSINARTTRNSDPVKLVLISESDQSPVCGPQNSCDDDSGLDKNIVLGLAVTGGIFGAIFLIFASLCIYSEVNKRKPIETAGMQESAIYPRGNSAINPSFASHPQTSTVFENRSKTVNQYEEIPYDAVHTTEGNAPKENDYLDLESVGVDRQDSGIDTDSGSINNNKEKLEKNVMPEKGSSS